MKKASVFALLAVVIVLFCSCATTIYNTVADIEPVFQTHRASFEQVANAIGVADGNSGFIHLSDSTKNEKDYCKESTLHLEEYQGLHIHSERALTDKEKEQIAAATYSLMKDIAIEYISFSNEFVRFQLYETNPYSWYPMIVYCPADEVDEWSIGSGEETHILDDHWYACIISR